MTFQEISEALARDPSLKAARDKWMPQRTNHHIWLDNFYKQLTVTTCDWPQIFYPTKEDEEATDWNFYNRPEDK